MQMCIRDRYSFQGLEEEGLRYMKTASQETGLATICEVTSAHAVASAYKYVDMLQLSLIHILALPMQRQRFSSVC